MPPYDTIRTYLRTSRTDAELKPFVEMAIAAAESQLGRNILHYGEVTPKPIAQAVLLILGSIFNPETEIALQDAAGLFKPCAKSAA